MTFPISRFTPPLTYPRFQLAAIAPAAHVANTPRASADSLSFGMATRSEFADDSVAVLTSVINKLAPLKLEDGSLVIRGGLGKITHAGGQVGEVGIRQENGSYERYLLHRSNNGNIYCLTHIPETLAEEFESLLARRDSDSSNLFGSHFYQNSDIAAQSDAMLLQNEVPTTLVVSIHGGKARLYYHHPNMPSGQDGRGTTLRRVLGNMEQAMQLRGIFQQWEAWGVFKQEEKPRPTIPGAPKDLL